MISKKYFLPLPTPIEYDNKTNIKTKNKKTTYLVDFISSFLFTTHGTSDSANYSTKKPAQIVQAFIMNQIKIT